MNDYVDNTTGIVREIEQGTPETVATLLGPVFRLPKAGVIRPGIMRLKSSCTRKDQERYERMVREGYTWEEIDRALGKDRNGKSKLIPANVDYFTVRPQDCKNPSDAETIHKLYADKDGRLRSFPIWFPTNEWWNIIPHGLRVFGQQQGLKFRSEFKEVRDRYGRVDYIRVCKFPLPVEKDKRVFGGRKWGERPCDPENCPEFQSGACRFGGVIQFYVPGLRGIGVWVVPTTSWYSLSAIKSTLEMVSSITGGRISGLFNGRTIFRLRKVHEKVSMIDYNEGSVKKVEQDLITLDVDIDMTELALYAEKERVFVRGFRAQQLLNERAEPSSELVETEHHPSIQAYTQPEEKGETSGSEESKHEESKHDEHNRTNGTNGTENGKELAPEVKKLYQVLKDRHNDKEKIKAELIDLTGKESFFKVSRKEAEDALNKLNGTADELQKRPDRKSKSFVEEVKSLLLADSEIEKVCKELGIEIDENNLDEETAQELIKKLVEVKMEEF